MKIVYQIGPVSLYGALVDKVSLSDARSWVVKQSQLQSSGGYITHTPRNRRIPESAKISIESSLIEANDFLAGQISARLRALGGLKDIPLIIFEQNQDPELSTSVRWLYTLGSITDVRESSEYGDTDEDYFKRKITVEMVVDPTWWPLLDRYWEDRPVLPLSISAQNGTDNLFIHPAILDEVRKDHGFYQWPDTYSKYKPACWPYLYQGEGYGSNYADFKTFYVLSQELQWAAPPKAVYAFTNLISQGEISITVNGEVSSLDLDDVNTGLASRGYAGLQLSDQIFVGMTSPFSSFVYRGDTILSQFVPTWTAPGRYPGELFSGLNEITIASSGTSGQFAANIQFGGL